MKRKKLQTQEKKTWQAKKPESEERVIIMSMAERSTPQKNSLITPKTGEKNLRPFIESEMQGN